MSLFPPLLKYWRGKKGLSQLDLGLAAEVSSRHISFLETGRAKPSKEMILTLATTLDVPLREQNTMLSVAGFEPVFEEPSLSENKALDRVIKLMFKKHEPYPMVVMTAAYDLINTNATAQKLIQEFIANPAAISVPLNLYDALFNPELMRPFVKNWESFAKKMLSRIHREAILNTHDTRFAELADKLLSYPGVPSEWRVPDFTETNDPFLTIELENDHYALSFLSIITTFSAPQNITAQELLLETFFPSNDQTEALCLQLKKDRFD